MHILESLGNGLAALNTMWKLPKRTQHIISLITSVLSMTVATCISFMYYHVVPENTANIALVYILSLVLVSRYSTGYWYLPIHILR